MDISGNTFNVDGIRLEQSVVFSMLFRLLHLQILGEAFSIKYGQLIQYPIPVPVTLCPFFDYISACKVKHLLQCAVTWKYTLCFCNLPVLAVQPFYDVCGIHDAPDIIGELEEGTDILPVADRIGVFLSPFLFGRSCAGLIGAHDDTQNILIAVCGDAKHNVGGTAQDVSVFPDFLINTVHEYKRIDWI